MSELQADSAEALERLLSEQNSYIHEVDQQIAKWRQFQSDYQHLETRLASLPDRLTHECMVPFGKLAFIPGRVIHSNEILVLLGENYFVERSCKQAREIVERRLLNIDDNLQKHLKEKDVFDQQKKYTHDFLDEKTKMIEIKEEDEGEPIKKPSVNRRAKLTDEQIREERRRLQERATKITKQVHFQEKPMEIDSDDDDDEEEEELPHKRLQKIQIQHTPVDTPVTGDPSPALFSHPGTIGGGGQPSAPLAFTGKMIERTVTEPVVEPSKRISKFKASRT